MINKFPRIPHLSWSPGGTRDDRRLSDFSLINFIGNRIVITEKMDGSNLCITRDEIFARSHSGAPTHPSFDLAKKMHSEIRHKIPQSMSVYGEWCFAVHSIEYDSLPGPYPFLMFGVKWEPTGEWMSWKQVEFISTDLDINTVPVLFDGVVEGRLRSLVENLARGKSAYGEEREGVVIWPHSGLVNDNGFSQEVAKWVKEGHPKDPDEHWMNKPIKKQGVLK